MRQERRAAPQPLCGVQHSSQEDDQDGDDRQAGPRKRLVVERYQQRAEQHRAGEDRRQRLQQPVGLADQRVPVVGRAIATLELTSTVATYLSIAALALILAVDLDMFTSVEMNLTFAVLFVVVATLAAAGLWALVRYGSDLVLGTELLLVPGPDGVVDEEAIEEELMWEFVASGVAGLFAGLFFEGYVRRRASSAAQRMAGRAASSLVR